MGHFLACVSLSKVSAEYCCVEASVSRSGKSDVPSRTIIGEAQLATIRSGMAAAATVAVLATGLLAACGGDKTECKDAPYKTAVQIELKSVYEPGKGNPEIEAAKTQAQSKWESEVKGKFGAEWASWSGTKSRKFNCGAPPGAPKAWTCEAEAAPCKKS
jgi:hypothetical protein